MNGRELNHTNRHFARVRRTTAKTAHIGLRVRFHAVCRARKPITLLLVDDVPAVRKTLHTWLELEPDVRIVGEAADGAAALTSAQALHPDVVLMDVKLPDVNGIEVTAALQEVMPECRVVVLSIYDDEETREQARTAGAVAFVSKDDVEDGLLPAIRQAVA